jgi:hypothetical protein
MHRSGFQFQINRKKKREDLCFSGGLACLVSAKNTREIISSHRHRRLNPLPPLFFFCFGEGEETRGSIGFELGRRSKLGETGNAGVMGESGDCSVFFSPLHPPFSMSY